MSTNYDKKEIRALVLTGGGVKGAHQVGALKHLIQDLGMKFDVITGISVGALNGSFLGQYKKDDLAQGVEDLHKLWLTIDNHKIKKSWFPFGFLHYLWEKSLYDSSPLEKMVEDTLDIEKLKSSDITLVVGAQAIGSGVYTKFTNQDPNIKDAVKASAAFPVFLKKVKIGNDWYVDGGVKETAPLRHAIGLGATHITILNTGPLESEKVNPNDIDFVEYPMRMIELQGDEIVKDDLREFIETNDDLSSGRLTNTKKRVVEYIYVQPERRLVKNPLEFSPKRIREMIDIGYNDAIKSVTQKIKIKF